MLIIILMYISIFSWFGLSLICGILGSLVVNYPFDDDKEGLSQYSRSPDDEVFQQVSRAYSQVTGQDNVCFLLSLITEKVELRS